MVETTDIIFRLNDPRLSEKETMRVHVDAIEEIRRLRARNRALKESITKLEQSSDSAGVEDG